jgi:phage FluMu protein Com
MIEKLKGFRCKVCDTALGPVGWNKKTHCPQCKRKLNKPSLSGPTGI